MELEPEWRPQLAARWSFRVLDAGRRAVAFEGQLSVGTVTRRRWSFGDGETSEEAHPVHVYGKAGEYVVTLEVRGSGGAGAVDEGAGRGVGLKAREARDPIPGGSNRVQDGGFAGQGSGRSSPASMLSRGRRFSGDEGKTRSRWGGSPKGIGLRPRAAAAG
jgi:hypothetical protein